eukprot:RCo022154
MGCTVGLSRGLPIDAIVPAKCQSPLTEKGGSKTSILAREPQPCSSIAKVPPPSLPTPLPLLVTPIGGLPTATPEQACTSPIPVKDASTSAFPSGASQRGSDGALCAKDALRGDGEEAVVRPSGGEPEE